MISGVGLFPMKPAQGISVSARLYIVAPPMPASRIASRSRVMPSLLRLEPIHIHSTWGRAATGGFRKADARSSDHAAESCRVVDPPELLRRKGTPAISEQNCRRVDFGIRPDIKISPWLQGLFASLSRSG